MAVSHDQSHDNQGMANSAALLTASCVASAEIHFHLLPRSLLKTCLMVLTVSCLGLSTSAQAELQDRGNGLIYDTVLDITWLQDANYASTSGYDRCDIFGGCDGDAYCEVNSGCDEDFDPSKMTWAQAVKWADQLNYQGFDDWRLASISVSSGIPTGKIESLASIVNCYVESEEACRDNEFGYMFRHNLGGELGTSLEGDQTSVDGVEFHNIQYGYWSNSAFLDFRDAFIFFFGGGAYIDASMTTRWAAWAVRDGDVNDVQCVFPEEVDGLTANVRQETVYLSWDESEGATQYDICWSIDGKDFIALTTVYEPSYEDQLGASWRTIDYYVSAISTCGESAPSEIVRIKNTKGKGGKGQQN